MTLSVRDLQPEDVQEFAACFERNGSTRDPKTVHWQFFENPTKTILTTVAVSAQNEFAAIYATLPGLFWVNQKRTLAVQSLDTLTDQNFRGQGLFKRLASHVFGNAEKHDAAFVYGFPNGNSAHGFFNRLGWARLDPVPFLVRPLQTSYFTRKLGFPKLPSLTLGSHRSPKLASNESIQVALDLNEFDADGIWEEFRTTFQMGLLRDKTYLQWRLNKPNEHYKTLFLRRDNQDIGFVSYTLKDKHGGSVGYIMELMYRQGEHVAGRALLQEAIRDLIYRGGEVVLAWSMNHSHNYAAYSKSGFLPLPEAARPIELHLGVRRLASKEAGLENRSNWYVSYLDSDTV